MEEEALALTSFGTSLSLSTTLRHTIQNEITTLDSSSSALSKNIQNETSIQRGIAKEMERAKREMTELKRGGGDVVDSNVMMGEVAKGWREDVESGIRAVLSGFSVVSSDEEDGEENVPFLRKQKQILKSKQMNIAALEEELVNTKSTLSNLDEETNRIQIDLERLNQQNSKVAGELEKKKIEREGEVRRNGRVKEAIGRSRGNSGGFARAIAEKAQEQINLRSSNISKETSLQSELDSKNQEMSRLSAEEKKLDAELAVLSGLLDSFIQQHVEGEGEIKRSAGIKVELDEVNTELEEVKKVKESKVKSDRDALVALDLAKKSYEAAAVQARELETFKADNTTRDAEILQPALTRKSDASKEKEQLVGEMGELHKMMAEQQNKMNEAVAGTDAKTSIKSQEQRDAKEKLEKAQSTLDELIKSVAKEEESNATELQETNDFSAHFEAATEGEITRLNTMKRQKTDERLSRLDQRRSELASLEDVRREEINHLREALAFLEKMRDVEAAINDAEIELTDDGEEVNTLGDNYEKAIADLNARIAEVEESNEHKGNDRDDMVTQASPSNKRRV